MPANDSAEAPQETTGLYPIRTVASLTGINPITLRAWERRYGLIRPERTPKGHRLYTQQDIERIQRVVAFLNQGISIGQVKPLLDGAAPEALETGATSLTGEWDRYQARMLQAIERFDEAGLDTVYNELLSLYPVNLVIEQLISPLLRLLGERWQEQAEGIAEEHFFSVYLRNKLGARIQHLNARGTGPLLLVTCLPNEQHEIGMLLFSLAALSHGYRTLVLGANLPLEQIPAVLEQRPCDAVVLSGSAKAARGLLDEHLPKLARNVTVPVFVGGRVTVRNAAAIEKAGAIPLGQELPPAFKQMSSTLSRTPRG